MTLTDAELKSFAIGMGYDRELSEEEKLMVQKAVNLGSHESKKIVAQYRDKFKKDKDIGNSGDIAEAFSQCLCTLNDDTGLDFEANDPFEESKSKIRELIADNPEKVKQEISELLEASKDSGGITVDEYFQNAFVSDGYRIQRLVNAMRLDGHSEAYIRKIQDTPVEIQSEVHNKLNPTSIKEVFEKELSDFLNLTESHIKDAEENTNKWTGTSTTYGDTDRNAGDAWYGEMKALEYVHDRISKLRDKINELHPISYPNKDDDESIAPHKENDLDMLKKLYLPIITSTSLTTDKKVEAIIAISILNVNTSLGQKNKPSNTLTAEEFVLKHFPKMADDVLRLPVIAIAEGYGKHLMGTNQTPMVSDVFTDLMDGLIKEIHSINNGILKKDMGEIGDTKDPFETKSFSRGKVAAFNIALNRIEIQKHKLTLPKGRVNLSLTKLEFDCMIDIADTISAMRGVGGDFDDEANYNLKHFDKMLERHRLKRKYT